MNDPILAFPTKVASNCPGGQPGMTLRDYFAAVAMQGFCASLGMTVFNKGELPLTAKNAYEVADAMLAEREKESKS